MILFEFPPFLVRLMLMRKEFGSEKAQQCRCPQVGSTTASNSHSEHGESDCDMPRANAIWGRENPPGWTGHVAADIKFPKMLEVHPLGILLNDKCSCQWNYLLNGWPYIGSVFCVFGLFSITLKTELWLLVWQILKRLQLWPQRMRRRIPNRAPMSAFIAESFKATCFDV